MFRDLYKKTNDEIKGDRAILDKAFLQAAQPEKKKSPVIKYSFVGTVVAAVMVLGAVFANPSVFTNRSEDIGKLDNAQPTEVVNTTEAADDVSIPENNEIAVVNAIESGDTVEDETPVEETVTNKTTIREKTVKQTTEQTPATMQPPSGSGGGEESEDSDEEEPDEVDDYGIAVMSLEGEEDDTVYEAATEEMAVGFSLRDRSAAEEATEEATEDVTEEVTENVTESANEEVSVFSYMYDLSIYEEGTPGVKTEGFVNTDVSPVTNSAEAIERAKNECTVEYDTTDVKRDPIENIWKVTFFMSDVEGGDESIYMNSDGVTQHIVYGE